jgi:hypothetical protein
MNSSHVLVESLLGCEVGDTYIDAWLAGDVLWICCPKPLLPDDRCLEIDNVKCPPMVR